LPYNVNNRIYTCKFQVFLVNFADYFGPRWHFYLGDIIASIPVPLVFAKGQFENGVATKVLRDFAQDPFPYLDPEARAKMTAAHAGSDA
jgi:hypothetical protein